MIGKPRAKRSRLRLMHSADLATLCSVAIQRFNEQVKREADRCLGNATASAYSYGSQGTLTGLSHNLTKADQLFAFFSSGVTNPIGRLGGSGGVISSRSASNTCLS